MIHVPKSIFLLLTILLSNYSYAQITLNGQVEDDSGKAISGAIVQIENTYSFAATNSDGTFSLQLPAPGEYKLFCSHVGYEATMTPVSVRDGMSVKITMNAYTVITAEAVVAATRIKGNVPMANSQMDRSGIQALNNGQDLPFILRFTPSMVTTSDAGAGIGYTGMRIRGSDASRINVTLNGIPLNDSESQGVFWVNTPDIASSVSSIQIQRGVGSSTNGAGAFGGSVSLNTLGYDAKPFVSISNSIGTFNTFKNSVEFGSGLLNKHWAFNTRLSQIQSDGYIDRASSDLKSYYVSASYQNNRTAVQAITFGGKEISYQSWYGTPQSRVENDIEGMLAHAANNGYTPEQLNNLINSGRTYNFYLYENEVDNYSQDHYQLHLSHWMSEFLKLNVSGHYTWGRGYFEQFRDKEDMSDYGLAPIILTRENVFSNGTDEDGNPVNTEFGSDIELEDAEIIQFVQTNADGDTITDGMGNVLLNARAEINRSDIIRRRWLDNDFYGTTWSLQYERDRVDLILGGAWNKYKGDHFGEIVWAEYSSDSDIRDRFYDNFSEKTDLNVYAKLNYQLTESTNLFGDVQWRQVDYFTRGLDIDNMLINVEDKLNFLNPKVGITHHLSKIDKLYGSYSIGNREPTRNDYIDAPNENVPKAESMQDLEIGYGRRTFRYFIAANLYNMKYTDQLVLTGELNDVGNPVRANVDASYRRGVELEGAYNFRNRISLYANYTYSQNKISKFNELVYDYTDGLDVIVNELEDTDISFSPSHIVGSRLSYNRPISRNQSIEVALMSKFVGEQYLDNSSNPNRVLDAYLVNDLRLSYLLKSNSIKELHLNLLVNNFLDKEYSSNGYTYSYIYGESITENFFYPQAGRNYLLALNLLF